MKCKEKKRYSTKELAESIARLSDLAVYLCKQCGFYHLTKSAQFGGGEAEKERERRRIEKTALEERAKRDGNFAARRKRMRR